jgi:hypothetical protein
MTMQEPREFGSAISQRVTVTLDDGRTFRAVVTDVRLGTDVYGYEVNAELRVIKDRRETSEMGA